MIDVEQATAISNLVRDGGTPPVVPSTARQGNTMLDELNMAVVQAAMRGEKSTHLAIQKYPSVVVENVTEAIEMVGYTVDRSRLRSYKEIGVSWP